MSKTDGTYVNFPPGLREALDLVCMGAKIKRTRWVTELVEDEVVDILSSLPYDVGQTLDNMHPQQNMMRHYKSLIDRVHQRRSGVKPVKREMKIVEEYEEDGEEISLDSSIIDSITDLS